MKHYLLWLASAAFLPLALTPLSAEALARSHAKKARIVALSQPLAEPGWVRVEGNHFVADGRLYAYIGANLWYGASLGADDSSGDRPRLMRELDRLAQLGVRNLRVMAGGEGPDTESWRIVPSLQPRPGVYNQALLHGLDFLLEEMARRHMRAIVCLSNYWHWSGGMAQYLSWSGAGPIPYPPPAEKGDWWRYEEYTEQFYLNANARALLANHIQAIVTRTNSITGIKYVDDPTIMTWELANEPAASKNVDAFLDWIIESARQIKALDPHHLVISGSEGDTFAKVASYADIDYATVHMWVQNAGWYDPTKSEQTYSSALERARNSIEEHRQTMEKIGKPMVLAEFGLARDDALFTVGTPTTLRDHFYAALMEQGYRAAREGHGIAGVNFWAWAGEGRPRSPGDYWRPGDAFMGDPPHEQQGWYGVYDEDESTLKVIAHFSDRMNLLQ